MPAPARYSMTGQPSPPAPTTKTFAFLRFSWPDRSCARVRRDFLGQDGGSVRVIAPCKPKPGRIICLPYLLYSSRCIGRCLDDEFGSLSTCRSSSSRSCSSLFNSEIRFWISCFRCSAISFQNRIKQLDLNQTRLLLSHICFKMPGLDAVSFLYGQVLTQIEYLHEQGHLSQQNYATIVGALMQASPPASPAVPDGVMTAPILGSATAMSYEPSQYAAGPSYASSSGAARPALSDPPKPTRASSSFLKFKSKSSDEKKPQAPSPLPPASGNIATTTRPPAEEEEDLGKINKNIRRALQGG